MSVDNINAQAMKEMSDKFFKDNTEKILKCILVNIEMYAKDGENRYCYSIGWIDHIDIDHIVKELKQRGFKVELERSWWLFGDVEMIIVSW